MAYQVIKFDELTADYNGRTVELRTNTKALAVVEIVDVAKDVETVNIKYKFISGDASKFKPQGSTAILARAKKMWENPGKYWLPYISVSTKGSLPENNDGRDTCRFCGGPTRKCGGLNYFIDYRVCRKCGR